MHGNLLHATVKMVVLRLKVLVFINHTVQWHMLTHSESTLILHICIDSLPGFLDVSNAFKNTIKISLCIRKNCQRTHLEEIRSICDQFRPVVSHLEVCFPKKPPTPKNIGEALGGPQRQFFKEAIFVQYDKNKNVSLLSAPIPIKSLPEGKKVLRSHIAPGIEEGDCSDACKFVARHCANGSYQIKGIGFYKSYSPVAHADSFRINIDILYMHRLTARIFRC